MLKELLKSVGKHRNVLASPEGAVKRFGKITNVLAFAEGAV